jgi:hypothetical protein
VLLRDDLGQLEHLPDFDVVDVRQRWTIERHDLLQLDAVAFGQL